MKKESPEEIIEKYSQNIVETVGRWDKQYKNGCNDPFWPDGCNFNLLRNHVIYYKRNIKIMCDENRIKVPEEFFLPTPQYINSNYFADPKSERAKRITKGTGLCANTEIVVKKPFRNNQLSMF